MRGRKFSSLMILLLFLLFVPVLCYSQGVAVLVSSKSKIYMDALAGLKEASKRTPNVYFLVGNKEGNNTVVQSLISSSPKVVCVIGDDAASSVLPYRNSFPIIYCAVLNPLRLGLSGNNVTGVYIDVPIQGVLYMISNIAKPDSRVGILYNPRRNKGIVEQAKREGARLGLRVMSLPIRSSKEVVTVLKAAKGRIDILYDSLGHPSELGDSFNVFPYLRQFCIENKIALVVPSENLVKTGAAVGVVADFKGIGRQAGEMVNQIMAGRTVKQLPPEYPGFVKLVVNKKIIDLIGFKMPGEIMRQAVVIK